MPEMMSNTRNIAFMAHVDAGKTRARRGIDPLDRDKYILAARGAMGGTVFD